MEPHNLKRSYWEFLNSITNQRISHVNRLLIDLEYGTSAGDVDHVSDADVELLHSSKDDEVQASLPGRSDLPEVEVTAARGRSFTAQLIQYLYC